MKKGIFSVTGCVLALGLVAVPAANAASVSKMKAKESRYHRSINNHLAKSSTKGKESKNFFVSINKNIDKINTNFQVIVQKADSFYSNSNTAEKELDFYDNTLEKLNASSIQLVTIQKQLDRITKKDGTTDDVTTAYDEVNKEEQSNTDEINKLSQLHTTFVPVTSTGSDNQGQDNDNQGQDNDKQGQDNGSKKHSNKVLHHRLKEEKNLIVSVNKNANKIASRLQGLDQNVKTFYTNPNTVEKELDFYNSTLEKLVAYSKQLLSFQKQLDRITKKDGTTVDLTAAYDEVSNLQKTITDEITKVNQLHTSFVPVTSGSGNQDPGTGSQNPGTGSQDPGTGNQDPGTGNQDPGTGSQDPGTGTQDPGTGN